MSPTKSSSSRLIVNDNDEDSFGLHDDDDNDYADIDGDEELQNLDKSKFYSSCNIINKMANKSIYS